jgi:uncharacterized protein YukE
MAYGNQMHMLTESAQHAATTAGSISDSLNGHVTRLSGEVSGVVGSSWSMDQAIAFNRAHETWTQAMGKLVVALNKVGTDTSANVNEYVDNDATQTAAIGAVEAPMWSGVL